MGYRALKAAVIKTGLKNDAYDVTVNQQPDFF